MAFAGPLHQGRIWRGTAARCLGPVPKRALSPAIQGLDRNTTYYIRAYAVNQEGSAYGKELAVKTDKTLTVPLVETSRAHTITEYSAIAGMHKAFSDGTGPFFTSIKNLELGALYSWSAAVNGLDSINPELEPSRGFVPTDGTFPVMAAGDRFPKGDYNNLHFSTFFWTSSNYNQNTAWARALGYYVTTIYRGHKDSKEFGFSVHCVRDD
jgi:hypothetical protein